MLYSNDGLNIAKTCRTNFQLKKDDNILPNNQSRTSEPADLTDLCEKVKRAVHSLKGKKSPGILAELLKHWGKYSKGPHCSVQKSHQAFQMS